MITRKINEHSFGKSFGRIRIQIRNYAIYDLARGKIKKRTKAKYLLNFHESFTITSLPISQDSCMHGEHNQERVFGSYASHLPGWIMFPLTHLICFIICEETLKYLISLNSLCFLSILPKVCKCTWVGFDGRKYFVINLSVKSNKSFCETQSEKRVNCAWLDKLERKKNFTLFSL